MLAVRNAVYSDDPIAAWLVNASSLIPSHPSRPRTNLPAQNPGLGIVHKKLIQSLNGRNASHGIQSSNQVTFFEDARFIVRRYVEPIDIGAGRDTGSACRGSPRNGAPATPGAPEQSDHLPRPV